MSRAKSEQDHSCRKAALCVLLSIMLLSGCSSNGGEGEQSSSPAESVPEAAGASYETCVAELGDSVKTVSIGVHPADGRRAGRDGIGSQKHGAEGAL